MVHFWHVYYCHVYIFSVRFLNMCKRRATFYLLWQAGPHGLAFYGKGLTCLPRWFVLANTGCVGSLRSDIFLQIRFIIFQDCPTKQAAFSPEQLAPSNQLLIQPTLLFQSVILHKMLKLGFWNFKLIFLDAVFIGCNIFFFSGFCYLFELIFAS